MNKFSVIMTVYDEACELENNLPMFLTQAYEPGYEVIVVDESSTDRTDDVLKLQKEQYKNLYTTFLPKPNRRVVRKKLALTIGVKAAKNEWVIFSSIHEPPKDEVWLKDISEAIDGSTDILLGYFRKNDTRLQCFESLEQACRYIRKAERNKADGHSGKYLKYLRGKYNFIVVRKDEAHNLLKYFEQDISRRRLLGLRISVMCHNLK